MRANKYQLRDITGEVTDAAVSRSDFITVQKVTSVPKLRPPMPTLVRSIFPLDAKRSMTLLTAESPCPYRSAARSEEHTSELQSLMRISYAVFCLKKKNTTKKKENTITIHTQAQPQS